MSTYEIVVNGNKFVVEVGDVASSPVQVVVNGEAKTVSFQAVQAAAPAPVAAPQPAPAAAPAAEAKPAPKPAAPVGGKPIVAPMPGKILSIRVKVGDKVSEGTTVCTLEAMKMEMPISATAAGVVQAVHVNVGDNVAFNDPLISMA